ncbi:unnamed protein product [Urochloa humidicola]
MQEPGVAEKEFSPANARHLKRQILCNRLTSKVAGGSGKLEEPAAGGEPLPPLLTEADVDQFASEFEWTGFTGGINYYRNMDRNRELAAPWADAKVTVPTKFIVGDGDLTYHYGTSRPPRLWHQRRAARHHVLLGLPRRRAPRRARPPRGVRCGSRLGRHHRVVPLPIPGGLTVLLHTSVAFMRHIFIRYRRSQHRNPTYASAYY